MKSLEKLQRQRKVWNIFTWTVVVIAVLCMIGLVVGLVLFGLNKMDLILAGILGGSFAAGSAAFGGFGFWCFRRGATLAAAELDALEVNDSPHSFFVGEGTFATLKNDVLYIHDRENKRRILVPYSEIRFFSICTRRAARERGSWSVVMEIPAHYVEKGNKRDLPNVLIQTNGKERLYRRLKELGRELIGELPAEASGAESGDGERAKKKFKRVEKFILPDVQKRKRALIFMILGALVLVGGIFAAVYWNSTIGSVIILIGGYTGVRATLLFFRAKAEFSVFEEGIFYREPRGIDNVFLKWGEFSRITQEAGCLRVECPYGAYELPLIEAAYDYIVEHYPDKCK